jgi:hypothetical protein
MIAETVPVDLTGLLLLTACAASTAVDIALIAVLDIIITGRIIDLRLFFDVFFIGVFITGVGPPHIVIFVAQIPPGIILGSWLIRSTTCNEDKQ